MVRSKKENKQLTDVELEMMNIIWHIEPCTVHQIMEHLPKERDLAYTSVSTMVRILEQKNFVKSTKDGRGHIYSAAVSREEYETISVSSFVKNVFQGEPSQLVMRLLASDQLSKEDLEQIKKLMEAKQNQ